MKRQAWAFIVAAGALMLSAIALLRGRPLRAAGWAVLAAAAWLAARSWNRQDPAPMPYAMRWILRLPRGPHAPERLARILQPQPGERILEVGPGIGVHALPMAAALRPGGLLAALDRQSAMLVDLRRRAQTAASANVAAAQGDAQVLPYPSASFDAAYLIGTLGEIPDGTAALRELRRVLKPAGRLVVGEVLVDPDYIALSALVAQARAAGLQLERTAGPRISYFALFRPAAARAPGVR